MKKIALSIALIMASSTVMADSYFRLGVGQTSGGLSATAENEIYTDGKPGVGMYEVLNDSSFKGNDITIGIGQDFNDYVSGEIRYSLGMNSSVEDVDLEVPMGVSEYAITAATFNKFDGTVFSRNMIIEEKNRAEGILLFKTPKISGIQPYILAGYSMSNLKAGNKTFDVSGVTYGAGIDFDFDNNWSLSLEYQVFPEASHSSSSEQDLTSDDNKESSETDTETTDTDKTESVIKSNYNYKYDSSRAMLSLVYRF
jgi:opacity protein-like surface antigen